MAIITAAEGVCNRLKMKEDISKLDPTSNEYKELDAQYNQMEEDIKERAVARASLDKFLKVYYMKHPETDLALAADHHQISRYKELGYTLISKEEAHVLMNSY